MCVNHAENDGNDQFSVIFRLTLSNAPALSLTLTCQLLLRTFLEEEAVSRLTLSISRDLSSALTVSANFLIIFYAFPREIERLELLIIARLCSGNESCNKLARILEGIPRILSSHSMAAPSARVEEV